MAASRTKKIVTIKGVAPWVGTRDAKTGRYVGSCEVLNLSTEADSWAELVEMSQDVTRLLLESLAKSGELEEFLRERGFSMESRFKVDRDHPVFDLPAPIFFTPSHAVA